MGRPALQGASRYEVEGSRMPRFRDAGRQRWRLARAGGVNANRVFGWRRAYRAGRLNDGEQGSSALLPVVVSRSVEIEERAGQEAQPAAACDRH